MAHANAERIAVCTFSASSSAEYEKDPDVGAIFRWIADDIRARDRAWMQERRVAAQK